MSYEEKDLKQEGAVHVEDVVVLEKDTFEETQDARPKPFSVQDIDESCAVNKKRVLRKMDFRILLFLGALYSIALIDRTNLGSARIGGMEKELRL